MIALLVILVIAYMGIRLWVTTLLTTGFLGRILDDTELRVDENPILYTLSDNFGLVALMEGHWRSRSQPWNDRLLSRSCIFFHGAGLPPILRMIIGFLYPTRRKALSKLKKKYNKKINYTNRLEREKEKLKSFT